MTARTYRGPAEYTFPHQHALDGATGTLVLTPGKSYDFGTDETGQEARPIGPAWWWDPAPAEEAPAAVAQPLDEAADPMWADRRPGYVPAGDVFSDDYGDAPADLGPPVVVLTPALTPPADENPEG